MKSCKEKQKSFCWVFWKKLFCFCLSICGWSTKKKRKVSDLTDREDRKVEIFWRQFHKFSTHQGFFNNLFNIFSILFDYLSHICEKILLSSSRQTSILACNFAISLFILCPKKRIAIFPSNIYSKIITFWHCFAKSKLFLSPSRF